MKTTFLNGNYFNIPVSVFSKLGWPYPSNSNSKEYVEASEVNLNSVKRILY